MEIDIFYLWVTQSIVYSHGWECEIIWLDKTVCGTGTFKSRVQGRNNRNPGLAQLNQCIPPISRLKTKCLSHPRKSWISLHVRNKHWNIYKGSLLCDSEFLLPYCIFGLSFIGVLTNNVIILGLQQFPRNLFPPPIKLIAKLKLKYC